MYTNDDDEINKKDQRVLHIDPIILETLIRGELPPCNDEDETCKRMRKILLLKKQGKNLTALQEIIRFKPVYSEVFGIKAFLELEHVSNLFYLGFLLECEEVNEDLFNFLCCTVTPGFEIALGRVFLMDGVLLSKRGMQIDAIQKFAIAAQIMDDYNASRYLAISYNNIGYSYQLIGDISNAVKFYKKSVRANQEKRGIDIARTYANIGLAYTYNKQFTKAEKYLQLSYKLFNANKNVSEISLPLFNLIYLHTTTENTKRAEQVLANLEELLYQTESNLFLTRVRMGKALILKMKKRFKHKIEAERLFREVLKDQHASPLYCKMAVFHIAEILLQEYITLGDDEILEEIERYTKELETIAEKESSIFTRVNANILRANIQIIREEIDKAYRELEIAQEFAEQHSLILISQKISNIRDSLEREINDPSNKDRMDRIRETLLTLKSMQRSEIPSVEIEEEVPIIFMFIDEKGMVQEKIIFGETEPSAELIGLFLSAVNTFFGSTFKEEERIERISSKKYVILLRRVYRMTLCYIFQGQSYWATKKLELIVKKIKDDEETIALLKESDPLYKIEFKGRILNEIRDIIERPFEQSSEIYLGN